MARIHYQAGRYALKYRGRGIVHVLLTKSQAKALFELMRQSALEIESLQSLEGNFND